MSRACSHLLIEPGDMPEIVLFPADPDVTAALWAAARKDGPAHRGVGVTHDALCEGVLDLGLDTYALQAAVSLAG